MSSAGYHGRRGPGHRPGSGRDEAPTLWQSLDRSAPRLGGRYCSSCVFSVARLSQPCGDMMTAQERIEAHLRKHEGTFLCSSCLAHAAGISPAEGRSIFWRLQAIPGFEMRGGKCVGCVRGKRVIRYTGGQNVVGAPAQVVLFLHDNHEIFLCEACIAFAVEVSLAEVRRVVAYIALLPEFDRRGGDRKS